MTLYLKLLYDKITLWFVSVMVYYKNIKNF